MIVVKMNKRDLGMYGEAYFLTLGNIENPNQPEIKVSISERDAEQLKPIFSKSIKSGKFGENEEWI